MSANTCSVCGAAFSCGKDAEESACWCTSLPPLLPVLSGQDCRCPACLKAAIQEKIEAYVATLTPETARTSLALRYATNGPLVEEIDYRRNAQGLMVFTPWYLLKQGRCCQSGCAHCPYGFQPPPPALGPVQ